MSHLSFIGRRYSSDIDLDEFEVINTAKDYRSVKLIDTADDTAEDAEEEKGNYDISINKNYFYTVIIQK